MKPDSRAGARNHPVLTTVNDRVEYISTLMAERVWTRETTKDLQSALSAAWGVAESTIRNYSSEAYRTRLEAVKTRRAEVAEVAIDTLMMIARSDWLMPGDKQAAKGAADSLLAFAGVDKPDEDKVQRHVISAGAEATPAKAREVMRGFFGDVTPGASAAAELADADLETGSD